MSQSLARPGRISLRLQASLLFAGLLSAPLPAQDWPCFRGPFARGRANDDAKYPERWDVAKSEGVLWKRAIEGLGHASPIVCGERVFVATAVRKDGGAAELKIGLYGAGESVGAEGEHRWELWCLATADGALLWKTVLREGAPRFERHPKATQVNATPACDGTRVAVMLGAEGLHVLDLEGRVLWSKDLGALRSCAPGYPDLQWGFASSPALHDGKLFVQCDVHEGSFLACFDAQSGKELWRKQRDEQPTWSTPTIDVEGGRSQVIVNGYRHIGGYDLATGEELWRLRGGGDVPVPTPIVEDGVIYLTSAHGKEAPIYALEATARGVIDVHTEKPAQVRWHHLKRGNYMQTPLVFGAELYLCHDSGVLSCYDRGSGEQHYRERLGEKTGFTASGVAADGKLYFTSEEGEVVVLKPGSKFEVLSRCPLGEPCLATPALARGVLYFRTRGHLIAIGAPKR
ncbi:MAG: PQQ-binding-like beta-propeller repeat protein [Planctomycetes bacterium]|nr:PQQ-binding-like beta-propeller repeat protein [Planctomycetota bacterium]